MEDIVQFICWIGIPAVLLSIGGGWWLMRKAFAPLAGLTKAAERITEHNLSESFRARTMATNWIGWQKC